MDGHNEIVQTVMKLDCLDVVEDVEQVCLDRVRVTRLAKNFQESGIRHEEEARKEKTFSLQITANTHVAAVYTLVNF